MQGQKQIFIFIVIFIVVCSFTFFRNALRRDKQMKRMREDALRKKFEENLQTDSISIQVENGIEKDQKQSILYRFLEYNDVCYDIHAIIFKPNRETETSAASDIEIVVGERVKVDDLNEKKVREPESSNSKQKKSIIGPFIYFLVIILVYSLIKSATDMSKHLKEKANGDDTSLRRWSLQEYANQKHNRRPSKAFHFKRPIPESRITLRQHSLEERRISYTIPEFTGTGLVTEPGTPAKTITGLASRPAPLLRRCSVPVFALQQSGIRRQSVDSYSEDDSSPDVKRRVRMIHRH